MTLIENIEAISFFYGCCRSCCIKKADIFGNIIYYYCELIFIADKQCVHFIEKCKRNQSASDILCEIDSIKRVNRLNVFFVQCVFNLKIDTIQDVLENLFHE